MNRKKLTALLLSSIMAVTPAMPAMADQSTVSDYVEATADDMYQTIPQMIQQSLRRRFRIQP